MENKIKMKVNEVEIEFEFTDLDNQFIFIKLIKEGQKKLPNFLGKVSELSNQENFIKNIDVIDFLSENLLKLCKSHDFNSPEKIEEFFKKDCMACYGLTVMVLGFISKPFQKKN